MKTKPLSPRLLIFAGANGSGKTTLANTLLPYAKIMEFVNADEIARGLSPLNPDGQRIRAGKILLERQAELLEKKRDFAIESTLAGKEIVNVIKKAKAKGYKVKLYFIYTDDVAINLKRVKTRVKQGGHNVLSEDIKRRYRRGLARLMDCYMNVVDDVFVYDGSYGVPELFVARTSGTLMVESRKEAVWKRLLSKAELYKND